MSKNKVNIKNKNKVNIKIADADILMKWYCPDCGQQCQVHPDFYQDNGTPLCECGEDMNYCGTEIIMPQIISILVIQDDVVQNIMTLRDEDKAKECFGEKAKDLDPRLNDEEIEEALATGFSQSKCTSKTVNIVYHTEES